jgi:hypothetical protein
MTYITIGIIISIYIITLWAIIDKENNLKDRYWE